MDKGHIETDKELQKMERRIFEIYARAQGETEKSWREYMDQGRKEIQPLLDQIAAENDEKKKKRLLITKFIILALIQEQCLLS